MDCQWFRHCDRAAVVEVAHPILEWVPTCGHHLKWLEELTTPLVDRPITTRELQAP